MIETAVRIANVSVRYESEAPCILDDISLSIDSGEHVALLGLNGSGKTTLLLAIAGILPFSGTIKIMNEALSDKNINRLRRNIGFLFNAPADQLLFPKVIDDVSYGLLQRDNSPAAAMEKAERVLRNLGIAHLAECLIPALSHGQKQRIALAGILAVEPSLMLLDEPSAALDPPSKQDLGKILQSHPAAMLVATHDLSFAEKFCSRFIVIENRAIVLEGSDFSMVSERWELPKR